jgi:diguanylate cyclase (GGDEF)-like protein/PAS domain S-box-containing protein
MLATFLNSPLKRRFMAAVLLIAGAVLAALGVLLYLFAARILSLAPVAAVAFLCILAGTLVALWVVRTIVDRFSAPLRAVTASLQTADRELDDVATFGDTPELVELATAVNAMRTNLRSSTISRDYLDRLLSSMGEALLITDATGKVERANAAAVELFRQDEAALIGKLADDLILTSDRRRAEGIASRPREGTVLRPDGTSVSVSYTVANVLHDGDTVQSKVYAAHNIDERKRVEQRIRYLARTDSLTKIANRMQFQHLLQQAIARARRTQQYVAIVYLDVDRFKDINDTFGHAAGDTSLEIFARRVLAELGDNAHAGRLAGDEFAILITGFELLDTMQRYLNELAPRLLTTTGKPFQVHGEEIFMTTSMGIAIYPRDGDNVIDLIRNADAALYEAKRAGGNCFEHYTSDMNTEAVERLMLKSKLRRAFERDELRLHYQPKYRISTGRIEGVEALLRRGNEFNPAARRLGVEPRLRRLPRLAAVGAIAVPRIAEPVATPTEATPIPRSGARYVPRARRLADLLGARDHRNDAHGRPGAHDRYPRRVVRHGLASRDRRLRNGLLVAIGAAAISHQHAEDRSIVRSRRRDRPRRRGDRRRHHSNGAQLAARGRRGGRRVGSAARIPSTARLRSRTRTSVRRSRNGRRILRAIDRGIVRHRQVSRAVRGRRRVMRLPGRLRYYSRHTFPNCNEVES